MHAYNYYRVNPFLVEIYEHIIMRVELNKTRGEGRLGKALGSYKNQSSPANSPAKLSE